MSRKVKNMTPVHRFASSSDIKFRFVTITEKSFEVPDVEHRHGYWTVFVFLKGKGRHVIDFKEVNIMPGSIHLVLPGQIHALHGGPQFLAYALMFTEEFFLMRDETTKLLMRLFRFMDAGEAVVFEIAKEEQEFFSSLVKLIQHEYETGQSGKGTVLLDLLSVFISKCSGSLQLPMFVQTDDDSLLYIQLRHAVEKNFKALHMVAGYASLLHVSVKRLNELCRKYTDMSALEFIHARLIIESKRLLKFSDKPIKEIAYDLHFTDAAHFTNFFRQKSGKTPLEFRGT
ncbi:MAG: helix-turn-helix transcriptional regulator [Chitinophagales bacterium]